MINKIKVARFSTVPVFFTHLKNNISDLQRSGIEVTIICSDGPYMEEIRKWNCRIINVPIERKPSFLADLRTLFKMIFILRKEQFHIVHSHGVKAGFILSIVSLLGFKKTKFGHTFTGQIWEEMIGLKRKVYQLIDKFIYDTLDFIHSDSFSQRDFFLENIPVKDSQKMIVLGDGSFGGVDLNEFNLNDKQSAKIQLAKEFGLPIEKKWIIFAGRVCKDKGIDELVEAFIALSIEDIILLIVGQDESKINPYSEKSFQLIKSRVDIFEIPFTNKLSSFFSSSEFLVLPSYREGFGTVVILAGASGIPTIGSNISGLRDAIISGETGLLVKKKDSLDLSKAMKLLILDDDLRERLGKAAHVRANQKFSTDRISKCLLSFYQSVLN